MDKAKIEKIMESIKAALELVEEEHGVTIKTGNRRYDDFSFRTSMEVTEVGALSKEARAYEDMAKIYDWLPLGAFVTIRGVKYSIEGYRSRARKRPILVKKTGTDDMYAMVLEVAEGVKKLAVS